MTKKFECKTETLREKDRVYFCVGSPIEVWSAEMKRGRKKKSK